jgi:acetoin:2,6-dichlorophenolindophenol oxidoreductase subunit beta
MPWTKVLIDKNEFANTLAKKGLRGLTYRQALNEAHEQLLKKDPSVYVIGEGVDDPGGVFGSTKDLIKKFGKNRVMDMPIAENGLTGIAVGSAMTGMKPIFVHMRSDFLPMCMDQIMNHAAKWNFMTGGHVQAPIVIRNIIGRGWGSAAQHSQALHGMFLSVAGLKIATPATPYDAKGLLISAVKGKNPVLFCEHRWLYDFNGYVPKEPYQVPFGKGVVRNKGKHVTVVALSLMVYEAIKAAQILKDNGVEVEVIDPRTIKPLDEEMILSSVKKTGRLLVADTAPVMGGFCSEVSALVSNKAFKYLKAPIMQIGFPDAPIPASPVLEQAYYPNHEDIIKAVKKLVKS